MAEEHTLGDPHAPVELVVYLSSLCHHCAIFDRDLMPELQRRYIDTGKVRLTIREVVTTPPAVVVSGFLMARCAGPGGYYPTLRAYWRNQEKPRSILDQMGLGPLLATAKEVDMSEGEFLKCITNANSLKALEERSKRSMRQIEAAPSFQIGRRTLTGSQTLVTLAGLIDAELASSKR